MIAILLDQGLPRSAAVKLRAKGWNINHVGELSMSQATDEEILTYARQNKQTVITLDADFHALMAIQSEKTPSVIRIRIEGLNGGDLALLLHCIWSNIDLAVKRGALVTITKKRIRIRYLPIN